LRKVIFQVVVWAMSILFVTNTQAAEQKESITGNGVQLVWQYIGKRTAYLAYSVRFAESGIFELYWTCNDVRDDSKQEKHSSMKGNTTYVVNPVPKGPVKDIANVIIEELPFENNQKWIFTTIDWTEGRKQETYAGESSMTVFTPEPVKNAYMDFQKLITLNNVFNKLLSDKPFQLFTFNLKIDEKTEIWELNGNWLAKDKLIKEYNETKSPRSLCWLLANVITDGMKREDVEKVLGIGTNPDGKKEKWIRNYREKKELSLQEKDIFVIYNAAGVWAEMQFRNGILINHCQEEYANPRISWAMSIQPPGK